MTEDISPCGMKWIESNIAYWIYFNLSRETIWYTKLLYKLCVLWQLLPFKTKIVKHIIHICYYNTMSYMY